MVKYQESNQTSFRERKTMGQKKKFSRDEVAKALENKGLTSSQQADVIAELTGEAAASKDASASTKSSGATASSRTRGSGASAQPASSFTL